MHRHFCLAGSINALLAVALGAFGAHGLNHLVDAGQLQTWATASQYQFYHALALLILGLMARQQPAVKPAAYFMLAGILLFSGSLYVLVLSQVKAIAILAPLGGACFMLGWLWLIRVIWSYRDS